MSNTTKKASTKGVRYTDEQKKEVVDFATAYNAENGRGGQSKAAEKFNISQLTIAAWLKATGEPSATKTKASKKEKSAKVAKAPKAGKGNSRYTEEQKKEVTDFVVSHNEANGRGGASTASKKFGVAPLTIVAWLKAAGIPGTNKKGAIRKAVRYVAPGKAAKLAKGSSPANLNAKLSNLLALSKEIEKAEASLEQLKAKFNAVKASL